MVFEDEASFWVDGTLHQTWSRVGVQPRVATRGERKTAHVFGARPPRKSWPSAGEPGGRSPRASHRAPAATARSRRCHRSSPTIGLLLCKGKNRIKAEYALRGLHRPIGVADWETQLVESLPEDLAARASRSATISDRSEGRHRPAVACRRSRRPAGRFRLGVLRARSTNASVRRREPSQTRNGRSGGAGRVGGVGEGGGAAGGVGKVDGTVVARDDWLVGSGWVSRGRARRTLRHDAGSRLKG